MVYSIIIMLIGVCILPDLNTNKSCRSAQADHEALTDIRTGRGRMIKGLIITFAAIICDASDSLLTSIIMDEGTIGTIDYMIAAYMVAAVWGAVLYIGLWAREKKPFNPLKRKNLPICIYAVLIIFHTAFYLMGVYASPVKATILWCVYPIIPLIAARLILKEKYNAPQYVCIWITAAASIAYCLFDVVT